jgi:hypothetical protein
MQMMKTTGRISGNYKAVPGIASQPPNDEVA